MLNMMKHNLLITEGSPYEFYKRYDEFKGRRFAINSAFQGNFSYSANAASNVLLRTKMKAFGFEVIRVLGTYAEINANVECNIGFVPKDMDDQEAIRFLFYYGKWFNQNGFFYTDIDDIMWIYSTRQDSTFGGYGRKKREKKFLKQDFVYWVSRFCELTYVFDTVKIVTD